MPDPVAEAAAQLAAQQSDPSLLEKAMDTIHELEAKVEHLIHPEGGATEAGEQSPATDAPAVSGSDATATAAIHPVTMDVPSTASKTEAAGGDLPNAASAAGEPTAGADSAPSADGAATTASSAASSAEPLHVRIAHHLEAIYTLAREHIEAPVVADTSSLKTHVGDILHRISNGMQVTEGELVAKLEALYRML